MTASFSAAAEHLLGTAGALPRPTAAIPMASIIGLARIRLTLRMPVGSSTVRRPGRMEIACSNGGEGSPGLTYKEAGVDIDACTELVRRIAKMAPGIDRYEVLGEFFNYTMSSFNLFRLNGSMSTFLNICATIQNLTER